MKLRNENQRLHNENSKQLISISLFSKDNNKSKVKLSVPSQPIKLFSGENKQLKEEVSHQLQAISILSRIIPDQLKLMKTITKESQNLFREIA
jgi:hypothetical protein